MEVSTNPIGSVTIAGRVFSKGEIPLILYATATTGGHTTLKKGDFSYYQVPVGKKLLIKAISILSAGVDNTRDNHLRIFHSDASVEDSGAPSGVAFLWTNTYGFQLGGKYNTEIYVNFEIPAGKYVGAKAGNGAIFSTIYYCEEVDV